MRIDIVTIFPEFFSAPLGLSIPARAAAAGAVTYNVVDLRDFIDHYSAHFTANGTPIGAIPGPAQNLREYDVTQIEARLQPTLVNNTNDIISHIDPLFAAGSPIRPEFVDPITAFMFANTDDESLANALDVKPMTVPSGLPVAD